MARAEKMSRQGSSNQSVHTLKIVKCCFDKEIDEECTAAEFVWRRMKRLWRAEAL